MSPRADTLPTRGRSAVLAAALLLLAPVSSRAEVPAADALLKEAGLSAAELEQIRAGSIVRHSIEPASERELTTGMAFAVKLSPDALVENAKRDLFDVVDPNMIAHGRVSEPATPADFAKLALRPEQVEALRKADPGGDANLSAGEIAKLEKLGDGASKQAVEQAVREILAARVNAYRKQGLQGVAPYALSGGRKRSPAAEIETATKAARMLQKHAPAAYRYLLAFPDAAPEGTQGVFRWSLFEAHGVPTIALTHVLMIPDGKAWILAKRQYYVSTGYNAEQEIAAFLPTQDGGSVVAYVNRTSTDQVTGFGGGTKRSIGSKLLASQIETLFEKARAQAK